MTQPAPKTGRQLRLWNDRITMEDIMSVFTPEDSYLSRSEICARLHVTKSKQVIALIEACVAAGWLTRIQEVTINRATVFLYERA